MKESVGIIGLGDLGTQLAEQIANSGLNVLAFDINEKSINNPNITIVKTQSEIIENCSVIHWTAPTKTLVNLEITPNNSIIVLHDSVMSNSKLGLDKRTDAKNFAIAHCLMNSAKRVMVAVYGSHSETLIHHLNVIKLNPKLTTIKEHDLLMAHSQGLLASWIQSGLKSELDNALLNGDLTPSGEELHRVLLNRELKWTSTTLESILANPELKRLTL